ncbi:hypothetical protein APS14_25445 [Pseudomonas thivervalensis]|nr:hypothetical protein APS14_25445 [Pseudomonas thivervalensis]
MASFSLFLTRHTAFVLGSVGAVERSEAAIFPLPIESRAKDQKIAGFASSYRAEREQAPSSRTAIG